jgi:hypothetical protein
MGMEGKMADKTMVQKNEIVSILNNMRLKHLNTMLKAKDDSFLLSGFVTKADPNSIVIFFENAPNFVPVNDLIISFDYNRTFYFSSETSLKVLNLPLKSVELFVPEKLFYHPMRKFARVDGADVIEINIKKVETASSESNANINIDELPATLRSIYLELQVEKPDVKKIIGMVGEELSRYSNRFKINVFKEIESLAPIEKVVNVFKKTFWVGDTESLNNYIHRGDKYNIIGYEKYFEMVNKVMNPSVLEQIRNSYISKGIASYAMVPIVVGERVVGVIEVSVPNEEKYKRLSIYEIFYIKGLADILGEVIVKSQGGIQTAAGSFTLIDLSIGGVLANTKNVYLAHSIKENAIVLLNLKMQNKELDVRSRITRYHYIPGENAGLNAAFEFIFEDEYKKSEVAIVIRELIKRVSERKGKEYSKKQ